MTLAWHFADTKMRDGGQLGAPGETEKYEGKIEMCVSGLHASESVTDALAYAPGTLVRRVSIPTITKKHENVVVGPRRQILWECDAAPALRTFARWCARRVAHLLPAAPPSVYEWLATGDPELHEAILEYRRSKREIMWEIFPTSQSLAIGNAIAALYGAAIAAASTRNSEVAHMAYIAMTRARSAALLSSSDGGEAEKRERAEQNDYLELLIAAARCGRW